MKIAEQFKSVDKMPIFDFGAEYFEIQLDEVENQFFIITDNGAVIHDIDEDLSLNENLQELHEKLCEEVELCA